MPIMCRLGELTLYQLDACTMALHAAMEKKHGTQQLRLLCSKPYHVQAA